MNTIKTLVNLAILLAAGALMLIGYIDKDTNALIVGCTMVISSILIFYGEQK